MARMHTHSGHADEASSFYTASFNQLSVNGTMIELLKANYHATMAVYEALINGPDGTSVGESVADIVASQMG